MSQTFLDIPDIIADMIRRHISTVPVNVVENIYTGLMKAAVINVTGDDSEVEHLGKLLTQYNTPVRIACWHKTDIDADALRTEVNDIFRDTVNSIDPVDGESNSYGINYIQIEDFESDDTRALKGARYGRIITLDVLWYLEH